MNLTLLLTTTIITAIWFFSNLAAPAAALDPGRVQGSLQVNGQPVALAQVYAHLHDNAEKLLDRPRELRLLLVDREVPQASLAGLPPLPVEIMAREGRVQGLLLRLDPNDHRRLELTLLLPSPGQVPKLLTRTIKLSAKSSAPAVPLSHGGESLRVRGEISPNVGSKSEVPPPALNLTIHPQRVAGSFTCLPEPGPISADWPDLTCSLRFSAPLFHELPVTAVRVGLAAQTSPQAQVLRAQARALEQGHWAAVQRLSTTRAYREFQTQADSDPGLWAKHQVAKLQASLKHLQRVVVRSNRAVAIFANNQWQTFTQECGAWQTDN